MKGAVLLFLVQFLFLSGAAHALTFNTDNLSFETGDLTGWTEELASVDVVTNATAYDGTVYQPTDGSYMVQLTPVTDAWGYEYARVYIVGQWEAGDQLIFDWAFLGMDSADWPSEGRIDFAGVSADEYIPLADTADEWPLGDDYEHTGWRTYVHTFTRESAGNYPITFEIVDTNDLDSLLLIDNIRSGPIDDSIPTLSEWGMIIMSLLLAGSSLVIFRRRQMT